MDATAFVDRLRQERAHVPYEAGASLDQPTIYVPVDALVDTCRVLRDAADLRFTVLIELTTVDWWPQEPRFEVIYHLLSVGTAEPPELRGGTPAPPPRRLRLKVRLASDGARLPTVSGVWPGASWPEREVWDLFGIEFDGHPDLRRILMPEDWTGHPLRKDYPVQIDQPTRTYAPLQLSPEEFAANITAARHQGEATVGDGHEGGIEADAARE